MSKLFNFVNSHISIVEALDESAKEVIKLRAAIEEYIQHLNGGHNAEELIPILEDALKTKDKL